MRPPRFMFWCRFSLVLLLVSASACGKGARQLAVPEPSAIGQVSMETEQPTSTGEGADEDGTIEEYAWDFDGDGTYDVMEQNPPPHTYMSAGMYNAKLRVTDNDGAFDVDTVSINATANLPPVAVLSASPTFVYLGDTGSASVDFDASSSYDPEGTSLIYRFDPEGDGSYVNNGTDPIYDHDYSETGMYMAKLKVEDSDNDTDYDSVLISVYRFSTTPVDSAGAVGQYTSLAVVKGNPAISYYANTDLNYVRASNASGSRWGTPVTVDSAGDVGACTSLAIVNGKPAISYYDSTHADLKFAIARLE